MNNYIQKVADAANSLKSGIMVIGAVGILISILAEKEGK